MIRRLAYVSRLRPGLSPSEIPRIVSECRARNELEGISGVLLFTGTDFAHLVEGPLETVADLWARIRSDNRHCDIVTLLDEQAPSRWFSDWRVGYPTDSAVAVQLSAWRAHAGAFDESDHFNLIQMLAAADAI